MNRLRLTATIDRDAASPDSIEAASSYLTKSLLERATELGRALDWGTWRTYVRRHRNGDLTLIQWAKVMKG